MPETNAEAPTWLDFLGRCGASMLTGFIMFLGAPTINWWWVGFFAWLPWLWAIHGQTPRRAFIIGYIGGIFGIFCGFYWMTELLTRFAGFGDPVAAGVHFLFSFWQGLLWGIAAALLTWLQKATKRSTLLLLPLVWTGFEMVLPALFPTYLSLIWCWQPLWIQTAEIAGVAAVSFVQTAINAALWEAIVAYWKEQRIDRRALIVLAAWLVGVPTYGAIRMAMVDARAARQPHLKVGVVQGNFGIFTYSNPRNKRRILGDLQAMSAHLEDEGAELLLWGETAYPYGGFQLESKGDFRPDSRRRVRKGFEAPLVFGAMVRGKNRETHPYPYNTALVLESDGTLGDRYDKVYPLAFGEAAPWPIDPEWYLEMVPSASHIAVGDGPKVLEVAGYRFGPMVCYEDILPRYVRQVGTQDIHAFLNLTNDSWFGDSAEQHEHLGLAVFRAIEHRRPLVRSVNAGVSAYVHPSGRVVQVTAVTDSDVDGYVPPDGFVADVPMMEPTSRTPFTLLGWWFWSAVVWGSLVGMVVAARRRDTAGASA